MVSLKSGLGLLTALELKSEVAKDVANGFPVAGKGVLRRLFEQHFRLSRSFQIGEEWICRDYNLNLASTNPLHRIIGVNYSWLC